MVNIATKAELSCIQWLGYLDCYRKPPDFSAVWAYNPSFGAMALLLAAVGIYGMLAYAVTLRRREIGIRMTLGSSRSGVTRLILAQAGWLIFAGVVPGLAAALVAGHAVRSFLFGVQPLDPASLAAAVALLLLAGMVAAVFPAWRAARVDPMEVLRTE